MTRPSSPPTHLDAALRDASDDARRQVNRYTVPILEPGEAPRSGPPRWAPTAGFAAVVLAVVGLVAVASPGDDTTAQRTPADDTATDRLVFDTEGGRTTATTFMPDGMAVGGPRDGKDSLQLPVEVSPADGLADGQTVTVSGSGFPPSQQLGIVMCAIDGPAGPGAGVDNCDLSAVQYAGSDAQGTFSADYRVDRDIVAAGVEVDCASPAPEGRESTCAVAVGAINDYDQSGHTPVSFDPELPLLPDPTLEVEVPESVVDTQEATITVRHVTPGSQWTAQQCLIDQHGRHFCVFDPAPGGEPLHDGRDIAVVATADDTGTASGTVTVRRKVDGPDGPLDCMAPGHMCTLEVSGPDLYESVVVMAGEPVIPSQEPGVTTETTAPTTESTTGMSITTETTVVAG